jgi:hypothetical protein
VSPDGTHAHAVPAPAGSADRDRAAAPRWSADPTLGGSAAFLALLWVLVIACGRMVAAARAAEPGQGWAAVGMLVAVAAGSLALAVSARRALYAVCTSLPFAVSVLAALLLCTVAGTLVLQGAAPDEYVARYGERGARVVAALGLDDVFHAPWFRELLGILAVTLVLVTVRHRAWQPARLGHLALHLGVVVVLAGGLASQLGGMRGRLDLREGQAADLVMRTGRVPEGAARAVPLGFALRLDAFSVDHYDELYRLRCYEVRDGRWRTTGSWSPDEAGAWTALPAGGRFRVTELRPGGVASVALEVEDGRGPPRRVLLAADHTRPLYLRSGGVLAFEERHDAIRAFASRVTVLEQGREVGRATIRVNEPFAWKGFLFYQSSWNEQDLGWSGLNVVRDPGTPVVFGGFVLMALGVVWLYAVRPRLLRRKAAA